jgi:hypothetical protein
MNTIIETEIDESHFSISKQLKNTHKYIEMTPRIKTIHINLDQSEKFNDDFQNVLDSCESYFTEVGSVFKICFEFSIEIEATKWFKHLMEEKNFNRLKLILYNAADTVFPDEFDEHTKDVYKKSNKHYCRERVIVFEDYSNEHCIKSINLTINDKNIKNIEIWNDNSDILSYKKNIDYFNRKNGIKVLLV